MKRENSEGFRLEADEAQMRLFLNTIFKHCAGTEGWIALRAFEHDRDGPPAVNEWVPFDRDMVPAAVRVATQVANRTGERRAVFSPPVAIFGDQLNRRGDNRFAGETNVICAPAIVAELDSRPQASLETLIGVLGEPTLTVASGGMWEGQPKLHAYWRLGEPAVTDEDRAALKLARKRVAQLVSGDATAIAISHPMRWPGSWHTKAEPKLCTIIGGEHTRDVKLSWAVQALTDALVEAGVDLDDRTSPARSAGGFKTERPWKAADLMAAAELIPNDASVDWDAWSKAGMAFYDASHGSPDGLEALIYWSDKNPKGDVEVTTRKWEHFFSSPPEDTSAGTLVMLARKVDPDFLPDRIVVADWFDQAAGEEPGLPWREEPKVFEEIQAKAARFNFEPFYEAAATALTSSAAPLIKGLLDQGAMSVVYGQSNVGKTFVTVDIGYHVATGRPYSGMKTTQGHVIYLSAEGGRSITKRLAALCVKHGADAEVAFHLLRSTIDLRRPDADLKPLIAAIKALGFPVALIVIDTLSRALAGGDENSSVDMGQIVSNFDKLREHTNAHLMVVHHSGKNQAAGARGHSLLRAATDTEIEVAEGVIEAKKQRDLDKNWSSAFVLDVHTLGVDGDGDPVTSCTVRLVREVQPVKGEATPKERDVLDALRALADVSDAPEKGISIADLMAHFEAQGSDIMSEKNLRFHVSSVLAKGLADKVSRGRYRACFEPLPGPLPVGVFE